MLAELVSDQLTRLSASDLDTVRAEAAKRPQRWRPALRATAFHSESEARWQAATLLDAVGDASDVGPLRDLAIKSAVGSVHRSLGRELARRIAAKVEIDDQGRVAIHVGGRVVDGTAIRRKVLALTCYLLTRPTFAATRDEVLDALWPDIQPDVAANSLNQTVYFLRRVIEPAYSEQTSPGFVHFESNVVWLDNELVSSRSNACWSLIRAIGPNPLPDDVMKLAKMYRGRFALDFAYEEWAIPYREALHASYLQIIENAVASDTSSGHYARGIHLARSALELDQSAENLEASLVRLYRISGAHAAAAEQYAHYAATLRNDLGVEAPALDSL